MSGKRMSWFLCTAFLLALMVLPALAETDEIVLTFGGDCVLGTREQWKKKKKSSNLSALKRFSTASRL